MNKEVVVTIDSGKIRGKRSVDYRGGKFYRFSGIPFAKPPVGELRFRAPESVEPWEGIKDCTKEGPECPQIVPMIHKLSGKEDNCLNLNLYTKHLPQDKPNEDLKKPVMFYVHGGGFRFCSNTKALLGPKYLLTEDIVLIVTNYRLGILGFLSLEDQSLGVPGNAGLKDQVMALKWVQKNVHYFGGDPNNVTIFGESAGAASVHYLTLSPLTKGLFHKAILQSGCALNLWAKGKRNGADVAKLLRYNKDITEKELLQKLLSVKVKTIGKAERRIEDLCFCSVPRPFGPVIEYPHDGAFLTEDPEEIIKSGKNHHVPMIIGYSSMEGLLYEFFRKIGTDTQLPATLKRDIPYFLNIPHDSDLAEKFVEEIKNMYFKDGDISMKNIKSRYIMMGDQMFLHGIHRTASLLVKQNTAPVYMYKMTCYTFLNFMTKICETKHIKMFCILTYLASSSKRKGSRDYFLRLREKLLTVKMDGISHGDDIFYLFNGIVAPFIVKGSQEDLCIQRFVKFWTNFARSGDPTPEMLDIYGGVQWPRVVDKNLNNILDIGEVLKVTENDTKDRVEFWNMICREYQQ